MGRSRSRHATTTFARCRATDWAARFHRIRSRRSGCRRPTGPTRRSGTSRRSRAAPRWIRKGGSGRASGSGATRSSRRSADRDPRTSSPGTFRWIQGRTRTSAASRLDSTIRRRSSGRWSTSAGGSITARSTPIRTTRSSAAWTKSSAGSIRKSSRRHATSRRRKAGARRCSTRTATAGSRSGPSRTSQPIPPRIGASISRVTPWR